MWSVTAQVFQAEASSTKGVGEQPREAHCHNRYHTVSDCESHWYHVSENLKHDWHDALRKAAQVSPDKHGSSGALRITLTFLSHLILLVSRYFGTVSRCKRHILPRVSQVRNSLIVEAIQWQPKGIPIKLFASMALGIRNFHFGRLGSLPESLSWWIQMTADEFWWHV